MIKYPKNNHSNALLLISEKFIRLSFSFFFTIWFARILGPEDYGKLQYSLSLGAILAFFSTLSIDQILLKELVSNRHPTVSLTTNAIFLRLSGCILALALCLMVGHLHQKKEIFILLIIITSSYFFLITDMIDVKFQSKGDYFTPIAIKIFSTTIASILKYLILKDINNLYLIASLSFLDLILCSFLMVLICRKMNIQVFCIKEIDIKVCKDFLRQCIPISMSGILVLLFMRIDQLILTALTSPKELGIYSAMLKMIEPWALLPATILRAYIPSLTSLASNPETFARIAKKYFATAHVCALILALLLTINAKAIIFSIFGYHYLDGVYIFQILSFSLLFTYSGEVRSTIFIVKNNTIYHAYSALIGLAVLIPLNFMLIPKIGSTGAAISLVLSYFASAMGSSLLFPRLHETAKYQFWPITRN